MKKPKVIRKEHTKKRHFFKDVGVCIRYINGKQLLRSKFLTKKDAEKSYEALKFLEVAPDNFVYYKCPECKMWHYGKEEWSEK